MEKERKRERILEQEHVAVQKLVVGKAATARPSAANELSRKLQISAELKCALHVH